MIGTAIGSSIIYYTLRKKSLKLYRAGLGIIVSGVCYAAGRLIRNLFLEGTGWEPLIERIPSGLAPGPTKLKVFSEI